jgi:hypothetical protein
MDIKLIKVNGDKEDYSKTFIASVDGVEITGRASNRIIPCDPSNEYCKFTLMLNFDNKEVRKHPKYKQIRVQIIRLLLKPRGKFFCDLVVPEKQCGVGIMAVP